MTDIRAGSVQIDVAIVPTPPILRAGMLQVDVAYVYGGPATPTVRVWNGTSEINASMTVWNGFAEISAAVSEIT